MKWLNKWFAKKCQQAWEESRKLSMGTANISAERVSKIDSSGMNFTVYRANGGHVIETRTYDRKTDRSDSNLHVITDDKDLGEEIGKIITYERLRA